MHAELRVCNSVEVLARQQGKNKSSACVPKFRRKKACSSLHNGFAKLLHMLRTPELKACIVWFFDALSLTPNPNPFQSLSRLYLCQALKPKNLVGSLASRNLRCLNPKQPRHGGWQRPSHRHPKDQRRDSGDHGSLGGV